MNEPLKTNILWKLLAWQLDELREADIAFTEGEDPDYQGTYTTNADIYWRCCGKSLLDLPKPDSRLCECHERDSSYVCSHFYSLGYRGHMQ